MTVLAVSIALWMWPPRARRVRVRPRTRWVRWPAGSGRLPVVVAALGIGGVAGLMTEPPVGLAAALLTITVGGLVTGELRRRRSRLEVGALLSALRTLAREIRSGAQPLAAITTTAATHGRGRSVDVLESLSGVISTGRLPGERTTAASSVPGDVLATMAERLTVGWGLSARHGVPWATLIDATVADLADRVRADAARAAQVSGPRVSGYVLAVLPVLGLLLGAGMGADPVHVLLQTGVGNLLMLVGSALTCAGLAWTARIVRT